MTMMLEPEVPSQEEVKQAKETQRRLAPALEEDGAVRIEVRHGRKVETMELPKGAVQLLMKVLSEMANGNAVTLMPIHAQLTTQRAADLLGVSRPFLIKEMKEGRLKYQMVGTHRRIALTDLMAYREMCRKRHEKAMDELVKQAQELDMGY